MRVMEAVTTVIFAIVRVKTMLATQVLSKMVDVNGPIQQATGIEREGESWQEEKDGTAAQFSNVAF